MPNYLSETSLRSISFISNKELQKSMLKDMLKESFIDSDMLLELKDFGEEIFTSSEFSIIKNLNMDMIKRNRNLFDKNIFLSESENISLIIKEDFITEFKIENNEIISFLKRQKAIPTEFVEELDLERIPKDVVLLILSKIKMNKSEKINEFIKKAKAKYRDVFFNKEIIKSERFKFTPEDIFQMYKNEEKNIDTIIVAINNLINYPIDLENLLSIIEEDINKDIVNLDSSYIQSKIETFGLRILPTNILIRILRIYKTIPKERNLEILSYILKKPDFTDEEFLTIIDIIEKIFTFEEILSYARKRKFNNTLMYLALGDE